MSDAYHTRQQANQDAANRSYDRHRIFWRLVLVLSPAMIIIANNRSPLFFSLGWIAVLCSVLILLAMRDRTTWTQGYLKKLYRRSQRHHE
jgi:uncharacterized membrane protein